MRIIETSYDFKLSGNLFKLDSSLALSNSFKEFSGDLSTMKNLKARTKT
ncbi:hypothetical protein P8X24_06300 [Pyrococcus kukulkanii]